MRKPTHGTTWGEKSKSPQWPIKSLLQIAMAAAGLILASQFSSFDTFPLFFSFVGAAIAADLLFQRCTEVPTDEAAWREFFERFQHAVDTTIYRLIGFPPNGHHTRLYDDIMQIFYTRLIQNDRRTLHNFRGKSDGEARVYLCRIAANIAIDILNEEKKGLPFHFPLNEPKAGIPDPAQTVADTAALDENYFVLRESINACLEKAVKGKNRERNIMIFKMVVYDGMAPQQIAALPNLHGLSSRAIDELVSRIRIKVRACLKRN